MKTINYINLTNGIEFVSKLRNYRFLRIQSTICENKKWNYLLQDISDDFLMNLAIGNRCVVWDCSNKKQIPRSLYQGIPFIIYVLNLLWFNRNEKIFVRAINCQNYFYEEYKKLNRHILRKIKYYRKFLLVDKLNILIKTKKTNFDGRYDIYKNMLKRKFEVKKRMI